MSVAIRLRRHVKLVTLDMHRLRVEFMNKAWLSVVFVFTILSQSKKKIIF